MNHTGEPLVGFLLCYKARHCVTRLGTGLQGSALCYKARHCFTRLGTVLQGSVLGYKARHLFILQISPENLTRNHEIASTIFFFTGRTVVEMSENRQCNSTHKRRTVGFSTKPYVGNEEMFCSKILEFKYC